MSRRHPCREGAKRRLLIYGASAFAITVAVVVVFHVMGLLDWGTALKSIGAMLIGDVAVCVFWWYFGDL